MRRLRRTTLMLTVWLTAATSLWAGMPRFACACACSSPSRQSGHRNPAAAKSCCCGRGCCATGASAKSAPTHSASSCCNHVDQSLSPLRDARHCTQPGACNVTLAEPEALIFFATRVAAPADGPDAGSISLPILLGTSAPILTVRLLRLCPGCAPPGDLVTTLQRLLI